ncbi:MAG: ABC transporter substrate-binding protein [Frankia sp.]
MHRATVSKRVNPLRLVCLVLAAAAALVACSSSSSSSSSASGSGSGSAKKTTVKMAVASITVLPTLPLQIAINNGIFAKHGIDLKVQLTGSGSKSLAAQLAGQVDITANFYEQTIQTAALGKHITSFVELTTMPGYALLVDKKGAGKINSVADLVGKKVGVSAPGSAGAFFVDYLLSKAGKKPGSASFVGIGIGASAVAAVEHGTVDAAVLYDPDLSQVLSRDSSAHILLDARKPANAQPIFGESSYPSMSLYGDSSWVTSHPQIVQELTASVTEAEQYLHSTPPAQIMSHLSKDSIGPDRSFFQNVLTSTIPYISTDGKIDQSGADAVLRVQTAADPAVAKSKIDLPSTFVG